MATRIRNVYIDDMEALTWMDADTKRMAVKKVQNSRKYSLQCIYSSTL